MIVNNDADLDLALNFRVDDFDYVVFITTDKIKCFGCGAIGHLVELVPANKERVAVQLMVGDHDSAHGAGIAENAAVLVKEEIQSAKDVEDEGDQ
ncbi:hypothetical protein M9458_010239, partial [Cirrhinus mrigala]